MIMSSGNGKEGNNMRRIIRYIRNLLRYMRSGGVVYANIIQINHGNLLTGKKAVVTGATSGIGLEIARKFVMLGADVCIVGRSDEKLKKTAKELEPYGGVVQCYQWDIRDIDNIPARAEKIRQQLGGLDIWVNNAGIYLHGEHFTSEEWDQVMDTDCKSLYFIMEAITKKMEGALGDSKKIINITSNRGVFADRGPYGAAKVAATSLTLGYAKKYATKGIIINGIAPRIVASNINHIDIHGNIYTEEYPNYRVALPQEIAELAAFLASDAANHIVGQNIVCDGGQSILSV